MTISPEQLLTPINGACAALGGVGRTKIYELVNRGELMKVSIDRRSFIVTESLVTYVGRLAEEAASAPIDDPSEVAMTAVDDRPLRD